MSDQPTPHPTDSFRVFVPVEDLVALNKHLTDLRDRLVQFGAQVAETEAELDRLRRDNQWLREEIARLTTTS